MSSPETKRPKLQPVEPTPPMPRGATEFEEKRIAADFLAVFHQISNALFSSHQATHEYAYRAGFIAGKTRREMDNAPLKLPTYIKIL